MHTLIDIKPINEDTIAKLRRKYPSFQKPNEAFSQLTATEKLTLLNEKIGVEAKLIDALERGVKEYAWRNSPPTEDVTDNMYQIKNTNRQLAVKQLLDLVPHASAHDIYKLTKNVDFQSFAGFNEIKITFLREHLSSIIETFNVAYEEFLTINNANFLIDTLTDKTLTNISTVDLAKLFIHYDSKLIADIVINLYQIPFNDAIRVDTIEITYYFMQQILNNDPTSIQKLNQVRTEWKKPEITDEMTNTFVIMKALNNTSNKAQLPVSQEDMTRAETLQKQITMIQDILVGAELYTQAYALDELKVDIISYHLGSLARDQYALIESKFDKIIKEYINLLLVKGYIRGSVTPETFTTEQRPALCQLLGIETPKVLKIEKAYAIDAQIFILLDTFDIQSLHQVKATQLLKLKSQKELPDSYGKPLSQELILQCIAYWYTQHGKQSEPEYLLYLIDTLNIFSNMPQNRIEYFKELLTNTSKDNITTLFGSYDFSTNLKGALLRTSTLSEVKETGLRFSYFAKLFNLQYESDDVQNSHNNNEIVFASVDKTELPRQLGFFGDRIASGLTEVEKIFPKIQKKHGSEKDFFLDEDDLASLCKMLEDRWQRYLYKYSGNHEKVTYLYTQNPTRSEKVYIALAEILTNYYRQTLNKTVYIHQLLMPNHPRFNTPLAQTTLAKDIALVLSASEEESCVDDIKLSNLIVTSTGYALCMNMILDNFSKKDGTLINPYTNSDFAKSELEDICSHPDGDKLLAQVQKSIKMVITERTINLLVTYLNKAIFDKGFSGYYGPDENDKALAAYAEFTLSVNKLSYGEREALIVEPIPGDSAATVGSVLMAGKNNCITGQGKLLTRVVMAYKGDKHGLTCAKLVSESGGYPYRLTRQYGKNTTENSESTEHLLRIVEKRSSVSSFPKFW